MKVLVTGCAGFIGSHVSEALMNKGYDVIGIDNLNDYYSVSYKQENLQILQQYNDKFTFIYGDILNTEAIDQYKPDVVCHLAALAGVRSSLEKPKEYARNNIEGFIHLLEECVDKKVGLMVYASSSSVYGLNSKVPFSENDEVVQQNSSYACTKKCMEIYADYYGRLYNLPLVGLRYFTVYGPRGRPDMAPYKFLRAIHRGDTLNKFGDGESFRDYTFVTDIVEGIVACVEGKGKSGGVYNLGNHTPVTLNKFISNCEEIVGKKAVINQCTDQPGDVPGTYADVSKAKRDLGYFPSVAFKDGLQRTYEWMKNHQRLDDI